jgi:uncharacterized protein (TIGR02145 family)
VSQNLNIGIRINGLLNQTNNAAIEKYCYNDDETNCNAYGGLYQWNEMMQYATTPGVQGICPADWHIPTYIEITSLTSYLGGIYEAGGKLKETGTSHWQSPNSGATNSSGFTALPNGYLNDAKVFYGLGESMYSWSSTKVSSTDAWDWHIHFYGPDLIFNYNTKFHGFSVRCIKN